MYPNVALVCACAQGCLGARAGPGLTPSKRLVGGSLQGNPDCPLLSALPSPTLLTRPPAGALCLLPPCLQLLVSRGACAPASTAPGLWPGPPTGSFPHGLGLLALSVLSSPPRAKAAAYWEKQQAINSH